MRMNKTGKEKVWLSHTIQAPTTIPTTNQGTRTGILLCSSPLTSSPESSGIIPSSPVNASADWLSSVLSAPHRFVKLCAQSNEYLSHHSHRKVELYFHQLKCSDDMVGMSVCQFHGCSLSSVSPTDYNRCTSGNSQYNQRWMHTYSFLLEIVPAFHVRNCRGK